MVHRAIRIFLIFLQIIDCEYSLEPPLGGPTIYDLSKQQEKYQKISDEIFTFAAEKKSLYIANARFHNCVEYQEESIWNEVASAFTTSLCANVIAI